MKTFKYIFLLGALLLASCTDFLDKSPDDMETLDMVFGNKVNTEEWLAGCIAETHSFFSDFHSKREA